MQVSTVTPQEKAGGLAYKWVVAIVVVFGLFMTILDGTIVNTAIPRLQNAFGADLTSVQWVLTAYTLAQGVATPLTAYLASRIGNKRLYLVALAGFTLGSAMCGLSWSLESLIIFRIIQAIFGSFLSPLAITLLYMEFPPAERGTAMGFLGIPILLAPAFGPTLGGYLVTYSDWQLIFYINLPIGIVGLLMGFFFLRESVGQRVDFDFLGFIFASIGLAAVLYGLSDAGTSGWSSATVLGCIIGGLFCLVFFVVLELSRAKQGKSVLLDLRVFGNGVFTTSIIASTLVIFALYGGLFLIPVYLQSLRGESAFQSGLVLLPQAFASMLAVVIGGRLVDKIGVRAVVIPGLLIMGVAMWMLTSLSLTEPVSHFQMALIIRGFGMGLCLQPLTVSMLSQIRPQMLSQASSVNTTFRFVMSSLAVSVISTYVTSRDKLHYARLAEQVTADSPIGHFITQMQAILMSRGSSAQAAYGTALAYISGRLQLQGYVMAMQDAFWVTLILVGVAVIASFFVSGKKKNKKNDPIEERPLTDEEQKAKEEALMAV
ncbi:DHA2 family efflux MFS transporter permease subunit [Dictyobacter aurantiacus]|uniref:Putative MFS-type transporter YhcA n=1 Tax=Dictyobacter aurantiacus TaxID=1936993 RepID=A0A401ZD16_9CHLR|nr:DHA2 family efflux MFS transporter permease subunit [Dictyobacter aurantiacus]GCE04726.1 putative MFS-type transporter YhcA [Dictyobacter aurantiacus]